MTAVDCYSGLANNAAITDSTAKLGGKCYRSSFKMGGFMHNSIMALVFIWCVFGTWSEQLVAQGSVEVVIDTIGSLDAASAQTVDGGRLAVPYRLLLSRGDLVNIDMRAIDTLDPYVILEAPSGERFRDDDGGDDFDAAC